MDVGGLIASARHSAGLTQAVLAELGGTSQATVSAYENGTKVPSAVTLARLLAATGQRLTTASASAPVTTPSAAELEQRGRVLTQVLDLAARLPGKRPRHFAYPRIAALRPSGG